MKILSLMLLAIAFTMLISGCDTEPTPPKDVPKDVHGDSSKDPGKLVMPKDVTPATRIAYSGHDLYFDHLGKQIDVDDKMVLEIEVSMSEQLLAGASKELDSKMLSILNEMQKLASSGEYNAAQSALLQGAVTSKLLETANKEFLAEFSWRHRLLMRRFIVGTMERDWIQFYPLRFHFIFEYLKEWLIIRASTDYVNRCRAEDVPIPPTWSVADPNSWKYQGDLTQNLLAPGQSAQVWTWADSNKEGACILLPRGDDGSSFSAILCQSKTTGKACIWENRDRTTGALFNWKTSTLNVNTMQDGDSLVDNCTRCHGGNNAFLISPDDPTWAKVIRPANQASVGGNTFTTNIASRIPRYTMISNQPAWSNPAAPQCIGCHERPSVGFAAIPSPMPPDCANGSNNNPASCY